MSEKEIVKRAVTEVFEKCGYADVSRLSQRDYEHISQQVEVATSILISGSTIKRLLHGDFSRLPQVATLNAIATFLGHKSWQEYVAFNGSMHQLTAAQKREARQNFFSFRRVKVAALIGVVAGVVIALGFVHLSGGKAIRGADKASLSVKKTTVNDIPNTVVFNYNIDDVEADSFFIQQSWDEHRRVRIFKNQYTVTDIYYEPGYHIAKLIANDSVIRTADVSIPTDRWFIYAKDTTPASTPEYISISNLVNDGILSINEEDLEDNHIDTRREKQYVYTYFPTLNQVNSDDLLLKTRVRVKKLRNSYCPYIMIEVFCQRYFMFFKATSKGCAREAMIQFGENFISGRNADLSSLGYDVSEWKNVELYVKDKQGSVKIDGQEVFATGYKKTGQGITGVGFISNGLCEIDFVELKGLDGTIVYSNDFEDANNIQ